MCHPGVAIAMMVASTAVQIGSQLLAHKEDDDYADTMEENAKVARDLDMEALDAREMQIEDKMELDVQERQRQQIREAAQIRVAQSEAGVFGNSQLMELANSMFQSGYDTSLIKKDAQNAIDQVGLERKKVKAGYKSRMDEADASRPSGLSTGLGILGSGLQGGLTIAGAMSGGTKKPTSSFSPNLMNGPYPGKYGR